MPARCGTAIAKVYARMRETQRGMRGESCDRFETALVPSPLVPSYGEGRATESATRQPAPLPYPLTTGEREKMSITDHCPMEVNLRPLYLARPLHSSSLMTTAARRALHSLQRVNPIPPSA